MCTFNGEEVSPRYVKRVKSMFGVKEEIEEVQITAKELFNKICEYAHRNGEPGIAFIDTVNKYNPLPGLGDITTSNPCVTADTWIETSWGLKQVKNLVGKLFSTRVNGETYQSTKDGFFLTGKKSVYQLDTDAGYKVKLTKDHKVMTKKGWKEAGELTKTDDVVINNNTYDYYKAGTSRIEATSYFTWAFLCFWIY